jgi:hypothetical protein
MRKKIILLMVTIFLTNFIFADNTYTNENSQKIDMHGGKSDKLAPTSGFGNLDIKKPITPLAPKILIEEDKKKEEKKEDKK